LLGPSNIDIGELLVRMQFAVYISAPEFDTASNSGSCEIVEDEDAEVIVEDEETIVIAEVEEETNNSSTEAEAEDGAAVSGEDPRDKEDGNDGSNVSDVISIANFKKFPELVYYIKINNLISRMASSGMLRRVALVKTDVSEVLSASIIRVTRICELGTTLAATNNRRTQLVLFLVHRFLSP
jgi:hypothetical protein